jgi:hypothetical protein
MVASLSKATTEWNSDCSCRSPLLSRHCELVAMRSRAMGLPWVSMDSVSLAQLPRSVDPVDHAGASK